MTLPNGDSGSSIESLSYPSYGRPSFSERSFGCEKVTGNVLYEAIGHFHRQMEPHFFPRTARRERERERERDDDL